MNADEVHICGEETVIDIIKHISLETGDSVEVKRSVCIASVVSCVNVLCRSMVAIMVDSCAEKQDTHSLIHLQLYSHSYLNLCFISCYMLYWEFNLATFFYITGLLVMLMIKKGI